MLTFFIEILYQFVVWKNKNLFKMKKLLRFRAKICYGLATILSVFTTALFVMLVVGYIPEFVTYPLDFAVGFFPRDNDGLLLICFFGLVVSLIVVPGLLIFGLIKLGHYLEKRSWRFRRLRPIVTA
jgi:fumarate reductase subunit D